MGIGGTCASSHVCVVHDDRPWARHHIGRMIVAVPGVCRVVLAATAEDTVRRLGEEIGRELHLTGNTVKSLARRLFAKLGVHERAHAVARAHRLGLFAEGAVPATPRGHR